MNCLEFRRRLLTHPHRMDAAMVAHAAGCGSCPLMAKAVVATERQLAAAFDVVPPADLAARVAFAASLPAARRWPRWIPRAAATVVLLVGLAMPWPHADLSDQVMSHMKPYTLASIAPVPASQLRMVIGRAGASLNDDRIRVTYAANCTIERRTAAHLVVQSSHGIVTVFLMPRVGVDAARSFRDNRWIGRIEPFGAGSIALIALQSSALEEVSARLHVAVASVDAP